MVGKESTPTISCCRDNKSWVVLNMTWHLCKFFMENWILGLTSNFKQFHVKKYITVRSADKEKNVLEYPNALRKVISHKINPELTRIFLTDVISKPDAKPWIIVTLRNENVVNIFRSHGHGESIKMKVEGSLDYLCVTPTRHLSLWNNPNYVTGFLHLSDT